VRTQEDAERYLAAMAKGLTARGLPGVSWKVWYDEPARAVVDAARYNGADLIVMSTHGRGGLSRLLLGSVAESVVRTAPAPVLLVRGALTWTPGSIGRILVPLDGSELSEAVLSFVTRLAGPFDFAIDLLRVVEPPPPAVVAAVETLVGDLSPYD
jgi:nucleotide-binding universal stress UspA family protein